MPQLAHSKGARALVKLLSRLQLLQCQPGFQFPMRDLVDRAHLRRHKPAGLAMNLRCDLRRCRPREQDGFGIDQGLFGRSGMCVGACRRWSMQTPAMVFLVWEYGMGASR